MIRIVKRVKNRKERSAVSVVFWYGKSMYVAEVRDGDLMVLPNGTVISCGLYHFLDPRCSPEVKLRPVDIDVEEIPIFLSTAIAYPAPSYS